jgi:aspartyl-tRNA(Asn)/glutamyl-tRNA(Gln) amidotransferase subunit C
MTEAISPQLFDHLVKLAALELNPAEADYLRQQLNNQLKSIDELLAIPIDTQIPAAAHGITYTPEFSQPPRADLWRKDPNTEEILRQAPDLEDGYIVVPEIPHTEI